MQTDPIGYGDGMNMYNYVGGNPVNGVDPTGLCSIRGWTMWWQPRDENGRAIGKPYIYDSQFEKSGCDQGFDGPSGGGSGPGFAPGGESGGSGAGRGRERDKAVPCSTAVRGLLANKKVQNAISEAVKLGLSSPNWGGGPHSEAGFWAGRGRAGRVNVGGVYSTDQYRNITIRGVDALFSGAFFDKTFFHLHLKGTGPSGLDRAVADSVLFGTGANIVTFDNNGKVTGCYAGS